MSSQTACLEVLKAGPGLTIQDMGRHGWLSYGVSRGGAVDREALYEGAALLGQGADHAVIEMPAFGGEFQVHGDFRIALSGAVMPAQLDGSKLAWNASHNVCDGQRLSIGSAGTGVYGYLSVSGGFQTPLVMGSRATHLAALIGGVVQPGDNLLVGGDPEATATSVCLPQATRFNGGDIRVVPTLHTSLYTQSDIERFENTLFYRSLRSNRQGVALDFDGAPFTADSHQNILSEPMISGDIQMTGDGYPVVLQSECQSIGGFARIAQVLPCDLSKVAQAASEKPLQFKFVTLEDADAAQQAHDTEIQTLGRRVEPLVRDIAEIQDLLSFQLISGVVTGRE